MLKTLLVLALVIAQPAFAADTWWDKVKSYSVEKKNDATAYGRKLVRDTDRQITSLERRAAKATGEGKAQLDSDIQELKAKRATASKKLDEMGKATGAAWDEAKDGFADAYKDLQDSYERVRKKLK
jgi:outer membrane murein-binding lipoprotein Lpp